MADATHRRFLVKISAVMAALVALVVAGALGWKPVLVAYHRGRMSAEREATRRAEPSICLPDSHDRYCEHRERLVELGHLAREAYRPVNVAMPSREFNLFMCLVGHSFPSLDFGLSEDAATVFFHTRPKNVSSIAEFLTAHDVPDFMERFGDEAEEARQEFLRSRTVP